MSGTFEQHVFTAFDLPPNRSSWDFRYKVSFLWDGSPVDVYYTDHPQERDRLVQSAEEQSYSVLVELQKEQ